MPVGQAEEDQRYQEGTQISCLLAERWIRLSRSSSAIPGRGLLCGNTGGHQLGVRVRLPAYVRL